MNSKTAILLFAQTASEDCKKKYFHNGRELFSALNLQAHKRVKSSQLPYFIFTEKEQTGNTFGERFTNAIEQVFLKGFDNVITIGNDSPQLKTQQLLEAANNCLKEKTTLGPTLDGGFYLLGIQKKHFEKKAFLNLPWQKQSLRKELLKYLMTKNTDIVHFCYYNDLDNLNNSAYYLSNKDTIPEEIYSLLQINVPAIAVFPLLNSIKNILNPTPFNKGSPC
tara:strand:+ start:55927 stop:56592 length:666 start_codon:yes stop_codon:yes gene_type:complete